MADTSVDVAAEKLGVGSLIGETFSIFFKRFIYVAILGVIPAVIIVFIQQTVAPPIDFDNPASAESFSVAGQIVSLIVGVIGSSFVTALIIRFAYDVKTGKPIQIGSYFSSAAASIVPIFICSLIVGICTGIASIALLIPGLYVYSMWCAVVPAIVIEGAGFGSFSRSAELTKNYRWSCMGAIVLMYICAMIPMLIVGVVFGAAGAASNIGLTTIIFVIQALATGLVMAFFGIGIALIYARLREIKEGTSVEKLAEIFA